MNRTVTSLFFLIVFAFFGCKSNFEPGAPCKKSAFKKYSFVSFEDFENLENSSAFNSARFHCPKSAMSIKKGLFDRFGRWDEARYPEGERHPVLIWKNVSLTDNSEKYNVASFGAESASAYYTAVLVFDENWNDLLTEANPEREKLIEYFGNLLKKDNDLNRKFYKAYWKEVDLDYYNKYIKS